MSTLQLIGKVKDEKRRKKLKYVYSAIIGRRLTSTVNAAIINHFRIIISDKNKCLESFFEEILIDLFEKESRNYHLQKFRDL